MRLWWMRKIRKADIPSDDRDLFERFGETVVGTVLTSGSQPAASELQRLYSDPQVRLNATAWLTERGDHREQREQRLEFVEWAILLFVIVGVIVDFILASQGWDRHPQISALSMPGYRTLTCCAAKSNVA